jgi:drug/metabolite transporter (DMT)-like permease
VICTIALLHMVAFSALVAFGLRFVPVGRSIVLGYTTPLWVVPGAWLFLREPMTRWRLAGVGLGLAGLIVMFNPLALDWNDRNALTGSGLILLAALCWAANILYVRAHKWISSPLQLSFWQTLLATIILSVLALIVDGAPHIAWDRQLVACFLYSGIFGIALAYWAMAMVNRSLPATTTSLGILATPVVGVVCSAVALGEVIDASLITAMVMILSGIALGTFAPTKPATVHEQDAAATAAVRP